MRLSVHDEIFRWSPEGTTRYEVVYVNGNLVRLKALGAGVGKSEIEVSMSALEKRGFMKDVTVLELSRID